MTTSPQIELAAATSEPGRRLRAGITEAVIATLLFALLGGAWIALFTFLPLDFIPPRAS
jgi:hypothetical protein